MINLFRAFIEMLYIIIQNLLGFSFILPITLRHRIKLMPKLLFISNPILWIKYIRKCNIKFCND